MNVKNAESSKSVIMLVMYPIALPVKSAELGVKKQTTKMAVGFLGARIVEYGQAREIKNTNILDLLCDI